MKTGGKYVVLNFLYHHETLRSHQHPPVTGPLIQHKLESASAVGLWILDIAKKGFIEAHPENINIENRHVVEPKDRIFSSFSAWARSNAANKATVNIMQFSRDFIFYTGAVGKRTQDNGIRVYCYDIPPKQAIIARFCQRMPGFEELFDDCGVGQQCINQLSNSSVSLSLTS